MQTDLIGKVNNVNLPPRHGLVLLFEAIVNSADAIAESGREDGQITITIRRSLGVLPLDEEQLRIAPIIGFDITDNGTGFDTKNFQSFNTAESTKKLSIGGKGVGRFMWLKAFENVHVDSCFKENGQIFHRVFDFVLSNEEWIRNYELAQNGSVLLTKVSLQRMREEYSSNLKLRLESIAFRIVEHFLEYFVLNKMPQIDLIDDFETINLNRVYHDRVSSEEKVVFTIDEHKFTLIHFLLIARAEMSHCINYCARHSVVESLKLNNRNVSNLPNRIKMQEEADSLVYMGYLSSPFLDKHVDNNRTGFNTFTEDQIKFLEEIPWGEIEDRTLKEVSSYLLPITDPVRLEKEEQVRDFIYSAAPQYRSVLKHHPEILDQIPPNLNDAKLEIELFKAKRQIEEQLREQAESILNASDEALSNPDDEINQKYDNFLEEWNDVSKAALAEYVIQRRKTLALLERYMNINDDGGYVRESAVHNLIFPMRNTSDDIPYERQNLWIIDEKLSFHEYLASDLKLRQIEKVTSDDDDRPDLLIFDLPIAIADDEPINGVTIFEFKRPMKPSSNPVNQMLRYVQKIREGKAQNRKGRYIKVDSGTPFFCFAVCDITPELRQEFQFAGMFETPDKDGFIFYNSNPEVRAYVEVIGYDKLLRDAKQRNRILFEKLQIRD